MRTLLDRTPLVVSVRRKAYERDLAERVHARMATYLFAIGSRFASEEVLSLASSAPSGAEWAHWWGAYASLMQRTSTWVPEPDPWTETPTGHDCPIHGPQRGPFCLRCVEEDGHANR